MRIWESILNFLYPPTCGICGEPAEVEHCLCQTCFKQFEAEADILCPICGMPGRNCFCGADFTRFTRTELANRHFLALTFYQSYRVYGKTERITEKLIYHLKQNGEYVQLFAALLEKRIRAIFAVEHRSFDDWIVTYPPRSSENLKKYGLDQSEELARAMAKRLKIRFSNCLVRFDSEEQKHLRAAERLENAEQTLRADPDLVITDGCYFLVDDIITSGATVVTAAKHLYFCGAASVFPVCIARTMPTADFINRNGEKR